MIDYTNPSTNDAAFGMGALPTGVYKCRIAKAEASRTGDRAKTPGALMPRIQFRVCEGEPRANAVLFFNPVLGVEGDLDCEDPKNQQSKNCKQWVILVNKSGVRPAGNGQGTPEGALQNICNQLIDREVQVDVALTVRRQASPDGTRQAGEEENRINGFYSTNEQAPKAKLPPKPATALPRTQSLGGGFHAHEE